MATKTELLAELSFLSDKLSDRSRVISGGVIATWWAALIADKSPPVVEPKMILGPAIAAAFCLLFDILQYVAGYRLNRGALKELERSGADKFVYDSSRLDYRVREYLFVAKQVAATVAVVWLIVVLSRKFWQ